MRRGRLVPARQATELAEKEDGEFAVSEGKGAR